MFSNFYFLTISQQLAFVQISNGRLIPDTNQVFRAEYFLADHLGNTRVVVTDNNGTPEIMQENHYYPFGMTMNGQNYSNPLMQNINNYLFVLKQQKFSISFCFEDSRKIHKIKDFIFYGRANELETEHNLNWTSYEYRKYDSQIAC